MARTDPNTVQSVLRAASLLDCFADGQRDRTLTELASATGLTTSTAYRLLRTLTQAGLLWREPQSERYLPGPSLLRLARSVLDGGDVASTREVVESLGVRTGLPVTLAVRVDGEVAAVLGAAGDGSGLPDPRGLPRLPLHATALGKVLLAYAAPDGGRVADGTARGASGSLSRFTDATIDSAEDLAAELDRTVARAYALEDLEYQADQRGVAVPVRGEDGRVVAALGVVGTTRSLPLDAMARLGLELAAAAGALSLPRSLVPGRPAGLASPATP
ncbi:IclR family transcriptional regulator [Frankia sp. AgB1.9]|uniref:IclR family transcriptional regulator n=1 Tax=unclassified Frankia TaxID=2632575 RepID=UPI0019328DCF|nr:MULTISPECIES: IclR family transcriptional regulator [unclassified Frankia]MBL7491037.1 IclR family transcriptional regulator [Frankia sp. AgW1.1]MBL7549615.1 IclR family transcriptional regulator [Frankia sp. AgB1.9]